MENGEGGGLVSSACSVMLYRSPKMPELMDKRARRRGHAVELRLMKGEHGCGSRGLNAAADEEEEEETRLELRVVTIHVPHDRRDASSPPLALLLV